ncbi:hypothetical protein MMC30_001179 [Trapelia coarctata]|nr:hypothetical protein [Trapelia coarctata]
MLRRPILISALLFYCYLTSFTFASFEKCWHKSNINPSIADCQAALTIIPDGRVEFTGKIGTPLNFTLPRRAREPKIFFPAIFRAGTCAIMAYRPQANSDKLVFLNKPQPKNAATAMYFKVWPGFRKAAQKVVKSCLLEEEEGFNGGETSVDIEVEGVTRRYMVMVKGQNPQPLGEPEPRARWRFNVYQRDEKGRVVRTCLEPKSPPRQRS